MFLGGDEYPCLYYLESPPEESGRVLPYQYELIEGAFRSRCEILVLGEIGETLLILSGDLLSGLFY